MSQAAQSEAQNAIPKVVEAYRDFKPPAAVRPMIEELLRSVPSEYLRGLGAVVLTNQLSLPKRERRRKTWNRNHKVRLAEALGYYSQATRTSEATVTLHVDNIMAAMWPWLLYVPFFRYVVLGGVLFHELGHHIHAAHRPIYDGKENVAEDWGRRLGQKFIRRRYWYLLPILFPMGYLYRLGKRAPAAFRRWKREIEDEVRND